MWSGYELIPDWTANNVAEYMGLVRGLRCAIALGVRRVQVERDSDLIAKQMKGVYQVKNAALKELCREVKDLVPSFDSFSIAHIPRAKNGSTDELANRAMDLCQSGGLDCDGVRSMEPIDERKEDRMK